MNSSTNRQSKRRALLRRFVIASPLFMFILGLAAWLDHLGKYQMVPVALIVGLVVVIVLLPSRRLGSDNS